METPGSPTIEDKSHLSSLAWSCSLVVFCGLLLGYYLLKTYTIPQQRQYQLDFGAAKWIEPAEPDSPIGYFRKKIFLSALPENAWLQVAASDGFALSVNGHTVASASALKTYKTGIYDIKRHLRVGTNVIGVSVSRTSYPGSAQLLVRGEVTSPGAPSITILSDETWRVSTRTGIVAGTAQWDTTQVDDALWPMPRLSELNANKPSLRWVDVNPLLLQLPQAGYWLMAESNAHQAVFSTAFRADCAREETWLQVASSGNLDLILNGHILTLASSAAAVSKALPHLPAAEPSPANLKPGKREQAAIATKQSSLQNTQLAAYDVSHWIRRGRNVIVATVRNDQGPAAFLADGLMFQDDGTVSRFSTSSAWHLGAEPTAADSTNSNQPFQFGKAGIAPWGYLSHTVARPIDLSGFSTILQYFLVITLTAGAVVALWLLVSAAVSRWNGELLSHSLTRDALLHAPLATGLLLFMLPDWDPRFPMNWSFQPRFIVGAVALLLLLRLFHLVPRRSAETAVEQKSYRQTWSFLRLSQLTQLPLATVAPYLLLMLIVSLGFALRLQHLGYMSFDHDEMGLIERSHGVLTLGIPYVMFGSKFRWATTYEAVPYPLALFGAVFGYSEWSLRLPSCIMGTLSIAVLGLMGRRLFNWRTGLLTAFIYACLPLNIRWAQNAFYPTQCQFFAILTFWLFYESIQTRPFNRRYLTLATITFILCYLSWEGTGFILPALFLGLMVVRWGEWWWLRDFHLYRCLFFIGAVVVAQYCSRVDAGDPFLQMGSGLSNLTGPSLFFLTSAYQPLFYIDKLLLSENHVFFTLMFVTGLCFCWKQSGFRYVFVLLTTLFILHTNFLAALSPRYCYYFQPLVLLGGVAAAITLYDRILALASQPRHESGSTLAAHTSGLALLALLFIQSNESLLKEYSLSITGDTPQMMSRMGTYRYDYHGAAEYVQTHFEPGDVILPGIPHVFKFYTGSPGDYFLDSLFSMKVTYFDILAEPGFADKFAGLPVLRNLTELKEVINRAPRTWIVFAPYSLFERLNSAAVIDYIRNNARSQFESYRIKVYLIKGGPSGAALPESTK